jgi:dihydroxy-acid dehydratase
VLADLRPSGKYVMEDLFEVGGVPAVQKLMLARGCSTAAACTVTGKTLAENVARLPRAQGGQKIISRRPSR